MTVKRWLAAALCLCATGCANQMHGKWTATGPAPTGSPCVMNSMEFKPDGTFSADATVEGKSMPMQGKYTYDGMKLKLDMNGRMREYDAMVWWGTTLRMESSSAGKSHTQDFKKG